jgi:glycosyltransferase involved in cell wall biosynthesis
LRRSTATEFERPVSLRTALSGTAGAAREVADAPGDAQRLAHPRVLQVVLSLDPGGTERLVVEIARRLHEELPMAVCCLDDPGAWAETLERDGIRVTPLRRANGFHPTLGRALARVARDHRADVLHCHHYSPFVYGAIAKLWAPGVRIVFTEHGRLSDAGPSPKRRLANRILSRVPDAVFAVSRELRDHLVGEGFRARTAGVIYNGIEPGPVVTPGTRANVRARLGVSPNTVVIGTIARLDPVKNLRTLIAAVATLKQEQRPTALVIVGDGPERQSLEGAAAEFGVERQVCFLGQREDARDWLTACDIYANSSISEGVSLTILEAMAASLPVVATAVGGTPEVVDDTCARLVPSRNADALATAIRELADDSLLRVRMGAAGRRRVEDVFTIERMVRDYRDVYCRVVA